MSAHETLEGGRWKGCRLTVTISSTGWLDFVLDLKLNPEMLRIYIHLDIFIYTVHFDCYVKAMCALLPGVLCQL